MPPQDAQDDNLSRILLMIAAMAAFAIEDALIKLASADMPAGQILLAIGGSGAVIFAIWARLRGQPLFHPQVLDRTLWFRNLAEVVGTLGFVTALTLIPISTASAILQASPIVVTAGAALFLGEAVGWRRWTAVAVGFAGVLLILRPGADAFDMNALWAVLGVIGLAARDLFTRRMRSGLPTLVVATWGYVSVTLLGAGMLLVSGGAVFPGLAATSYIAGAVVIGAVAYWAIIEATRAGDVAVVQPFRYSRLVFAMIIGFVIFGELPDGITYLGAALVVGSGLYTLARERARKRASLRP
jgi:drug/metabolite transporter (DMT)-like permease